MTTNDLAWKIYQFYLQCGEEEWSTANIEKKLKEWQFLPAAQPTFKIGQIVKHYGRDLKIDSIWVRQDGFWYQLDYMDERIEKGVMTIISEFKLLEHNSKVTWLEIEKY